MAKRFRFRTIPFIATVLVAAAGIALGNWQQGRAAGKLALQAEMDQRAHAAPLSIGSDPVPVEAVRFHPISVTGRFLPAWTIYLENRPLNGRVGSYVLMPLQIGDSNMHVLVARGWVPRDNADRTRMPAIATPAGTVTVTGIAQPTIGHVMQLGQAPAVKPQAILQNVTVAEFAQASGLSLQPFFLAQSAPSAPGDVLERRWPAPALGAEKNQGYAFQWYGLAAMAVLFFIFTGFKRGKNDV